jgi:hypothetical protein
MFVIVRNASASTDASAPASVGVVADVAGAEAVTGVVEADGVAEGAALGGGVAVPASLGAGRSFAQAVVTTRSSTAGRTTFADPNMLAQSLAFSVHEEP